MPPSPRIKWAISSVSLGKHSSHILERKILAASTNNFAGLEIVYHELAQHATSKSQKIIDSAKDIGDFSRKHGIEILCLNAFKNFEGNLVVPLSERLNLGKEWAGVALALDTKVIQVPSMFLPDSTREEAVIVKELQALADLAGEHGLEVAYEAVVFAKHNALWQDSLRIARAVNRPNFRICLDSYHIHARLWGDACALDGIIFSSNES